ncbi:MAG: 16S rRNA (cytidine(1402)-2'-O)-methyltransferase [Tannerella sp.]|jgi:16S rRNA (cytidine1402-2'-O)-methyltransferase|nr:16S rRNA (cytidine(1402)-2'-O)-methyltransferase [Tannerella sp.]
MNAKLSIVPTPIGNLEDISFRAIRILKQASLILCEDTRTSDILLKHYEIKNRLQSHHKFNEHHTVTDIVEKIKAGQNIALISDAGTPAVSDPGFLLVRECIRNNISVECLPGATAFLPALVVSGLPCDRFCFEGFLPLKKGRRTRLNEIASEKRTTVLYESPYRLLKTLGQLLDTCGGERRASISREISKKFEETVRGTLLEIIRYFTTNEPKGEFVITLESAAKEQQTNKQQTT